MGQEYELQPSPITRTAKSVVDNVVYGTWTPEMSFSITNGDLNVVYTANVGQYVRTQNICHLFFRILTGVYTHSSASGALRFINIPFHGARQASLTSATYCGVCDYRGDGLVLGAGTTDIYPKITTDFTGSQPTTYMDFQSRGPGILGITLTSISAPSGAILVFNGSVTYPIYLT